jgi:hypothetical protein
MNTMNRVSYLGVIAALSLVLLVGMSLTKNNSAVAAEAELIKIQPVVGPGVVEVTGMSIEPQTLTTKENTIVIWVNAIPQQEVQVVFQDGRACKDVTTNPVGFKLDSSACYVTSYVPFADTSSLQFPQAGIYNYIVQTAGGKMRAKGVIEVSK